MLSEAEYQLALIIWNSQKISSKELIQKAWEQYQWKKSTTYTLLKRMISKDLAINDNGMISMTISKQKIDNQKTQDLFDKSFDHSLPKLISAYYQGQPITKEEASTILALIKQFEDELDN